MATSQSQDPLAQQIQQQWAGWDQPHAEEFARLLRANGVTELGDLSWVDKTDYSGLEQRDGKWGKMVTAYNGENQDPYEYWSELGDTQGAGVAQRRLKIGDKEVGYLGDINNDGSVGTNRYDYLKDPTADLLGWSATQHGQTGYRVVTDPKTGKLYVEPQWGSSSDADTARGVATVAAIGAGGAYAAGQMAGGAAAAGGAEGVGAVSGMDLAADAALATGNNITTAGGLLGSTMPAAGTGTLTTGGVGSAPLETSAPLQTIGQAAPIGEVTPATQTLDTGLLSSGTGGTGGTAAGGGTAAASGGGGSGGYSAAQNYGAGMTGAQTSAYDSVIGATGSGTLANAASEAVGAAGSGWDWLKSVGSAVSGGSSLFSNPLLNTLIGAGVQQWNLERMADDQRQWTQQQEANKRRRQAPVGLLGAHLTVKKGTPRAS
jgi:hypothetical protein